MNEMSELELELLSSAREELEPSDNDRLRVARGLSAALAGTAVGMSGVAEVAASTKVGASTATASGAIKTAALGTGASVAGPLVTGATSAGVSVTGVKLVLLGVLGGIGFGSSSVLWSDPAPKSSPVAARVEPVDEERADVESVPRPEDDSVIVPAEKPLEEKKHRQIRKLKGPGTPSSVVDSGNRPDAKETPQKQSTNLSSELVLLARARQALARADGAGALGLLKQLDKEHTGGVFVEERRASHILALCLLGQTSKARQEVERFARRWPRSVYADRINRCASGTSAKMIDQGARSK